MSEYNNCRDVGEMINLIAGKPILREKCIYRGGSTDYISNTTSIGHPKTIINLRNVDDRNKFGAIYHYFPSPNNIETYDTSKERVRRWLNDIMTIFDSTPYPIFIHCFVGKDRTGVVIAALLKILNIPNEWIIEEYLMSQGEIDANLITKTLSHLSEPKQYFYKIPDLNKIRVMLRTNN